MKKPERILNRIAPVLGLALICGVIALLVASNTAPVQAEPVGNRFTVKNPIDKFVLQGLSELKIEPSPICTDEEFIRRAYLDVCGVTPTGDTVRAFLNDKSPDKRAKAIDKLLSSKRYGEHWATLWCDLLREQTNAKNGQGTIRGSYRDWIEKSLDSNMPYDQFMRELITGTGSADESGAVNFYLRDNKGNNFDSVEVVNTVSSAFMGTRMACAQCHDHPFDKWMQSDFHSLMAFFNRTSCPIDMVDTLIRLEDEKGLPQNVRDFLAPHIKEAKDVAAKTDKKQMTASLAAVSAKGGKGNDAMMGMMEDTMTSMGKGLNIRREIEKLVPKEEYQRVNNMIQRHEMRQVVEGVMGEYKMPAEGDSQDKKRRQGGEVVKPVFPWDQSKSAPSVGFRRVALADNIASHRQFATVQANRVWSQLLGRGIVNPVDDFRPKNAPSNPELLEYITDEFVKSKFDNKVLIRLIMNSSTYQASSMPNSTNKNDSTLFSHQHLRKMTAEQAFDSILVATGRDNGMYGEREEGIGGGKRNNAGTANVQWAADAPVPARVGSYLNTFNQPSREQTMVERDHTGSIPQALEMMNGPHVNGMLRSSPLLARLVKEKASAQTVTEELYLWTLSRMPTSGEMSNARRFLQTDIPTKEAIEDLHWALMNAREFMFVR